VHTVKESTNSKYQERITSSNQFTEKKRASSSSTAVGAGGIRRRQSSPTSSTTAAEIEDWTELIEEQYEYIRDCDTPTSGRRLYQRGETCGIKVKTRLIL
jgi:hypothetical protein